MSQLLTFAKVRFIFSAFAGLNVVVQFVPATVSNMAIS